MPPKLDNNLVGRLGRLADKIDGARPGEWESNLAEFNRLAGTALVFRNFQGIYGAEEAEDWVKRLLTCQCVKPFSGVTRAELVELVVRIKASGPEQEAFMAIFDANVPLRNASNLVFYPPDFDARTNTWGGGAIGDYDPSPEQVVTWALDPNARGPAAT
jgi:hypothetical protein